MLLFISCTNNFSKESNSFILKRSDSISFLIEKSKNSSLSFEERTKNLFKANELNNLLQDSLKIIYLDGIINEAYELKDVSFFKQVNKERLVLSKKLKDSFRIGQYYYYEAHDYQRKEALDSAYYCFNLAKKYFDEINNTYYSARVLYSLSLIKKDIRDYTGCEKLTFEAIKKFRPLNKNTSLFKCYNLLGNNFYELGELNEALKKHEKASEYLKKSKYKDQFVNTNLNNIGLVYEKMGKHDVAVEYFQKALDDYYLRNDDPENHARLLGNLAYNKFKNGDTLGVYKILKKTLKIRDSINFISGIVLNNIYLAEFYSFRGDTTKAINYLKKAKKLAKDVNNNRDHLVSLKMLSQLDKKNAATYLDNYIKLSDSLQKQERTVRNKFTRIEYETDEYIQETKRLTTQNILISVIAGIIVILLGLLYFIRQQRTKNKELLFEQEQQRANQEIYDLMLKRQSNLEEGRTQERHRISEELHDGVLGKLFGARVGMGYLSLTGDEEDVTEYKGYLDELQGIEKEIRDISHALKSNILKTDNSFLGVIEEYVSNQSKVHGFECVINTEKDINWLAIDDKLKVTLYRIVQEAIQNVIKHASANKIDITFAKTAEMLNLNINDDGKGFNTLKGKKGIGLKNMESRILKHNGIFRINSKEGQGTSVNITVSI